MNTWSNEKMKRMDDEVAAKIAAFPVKTFREVIAANGGKPLVVAVKEDGVTYTAECWSDDPDGVDQPASFNVYMGGTPFTHMDRPKNETLAALKTGAEKSAGVALDDFVGGDENFFEQLGSADWVKAQETEAAK